jgi:hypothetical protein
MLRSGHRRFYDGILRRVYRLADPTRSRHEILPRIGRENVNKAGERCSQQFGVRHVTEISRIFLSQSIVVSILSGANPLQEKAAAQCWDSQQVQTEATIVQNSLYCLKPDFPIAASTLKGVRQESFVCRERVVSRRPTSTTLVVLRTS